MTPRFADSRSGLPTASVDGRSLHSAWDPRAEADRFIRSPDSAAGASDATSIVIVIGACLDYLAEALATLHPGIDIIGIQLSSAFRGRERPGARAYWYPDSEVGLEPFLLGAIDAEALSPIAILEWPPAVEAFAGAAKAAREAVAAFLARSASEAATTRTVGRRWIANSVRGFMQAETLALIAGDDRPIAVLGAGPTLPSALELLAPHADSFRVIAVASATAAALARGFVPELVVSTDPGFWSGVHLHAARRAGIPVFSPLSAFPVPRELPWGVIDQGYFFETVFARELGPSIGLPSHGTVSGSALSLAARLSPGHVVLAGFDFAATGSESHGRPHGFDRHILAGETRLAPGEGLRWERLAETNPERLGDTGWRGSRALRIYADAVAADSRALAQRLWRIAPSPVVIPGARSAGSADLKAIAASVASPGRGIPSTVPAPPSALRAERLAAILRSWRKATEAVLSPQAPAPDAREPIVDLFRCVDLPDWAAIRRAARLGRAARESAERLKSEVDDFVSYLESRWGS